MLNVNNLNVGDKVWMIKSGINIPVEILSEPISSTSMSSGNSTYRVDVKIAFLDEHETLISDGCEFNNLFDFPSYTRHEFDMTNYKLLHDNGWNSFF
jgi:hypothetical protein